MRVRQETDSGDMTFGNGALNFLANSPAAVAQIVKTRLMMKTGEWYLDLAGGTPWSTDIVGFSSQAERELVLRERINGTINVTGITSFSAPVVGRKLSVTATIQTDFSLTPAVVETPL